jgi:hypothetical protein
MNAQEMYDKWSGLSLPLRVATGAVALTGAVTLAGLGGAGLYALLDPKGLRRRGRQAALSAVEKSEASMDSLAELLKHDRPGGLTPYGVLSSTGPGVGVGLERFPGFVGADTTGIDAGYILQPRQAEWMLRPFTGRERAHELIGKLPAKPFVAARLGPTLFPLEAGVVVGKGEVAATREALRKLHQSLEERKEAIKEALA